jgi:mediator of RNA polymerase II transcription subunit 16, fungi type
MLNIIAFPLDLLSDVARVLNFHVDYSDESHHDTLVRNPSIQLCLSVLNSLGYNGDLQPRRFGAKMAWISLQIRNCVVLMTMTTSVKLPDPEHPQNPQKKLSGIEDAGKLRRT